MNRPALHTFHIPVMGLCYTINTPVKVAHFGISSVISIIEDELIEQMRKYHCKQSGETYIAITNKEEDYRAKRITAYLNLVHRIVNRNTENLRCLPFEQGSDIVKYFELLPDESPVKKVYSTMMQMQEGHSKELLQEQLRNKIAAGAIDVNIMSKVDKQNYNKAGEPLPAEFSDAMSSLRGFANSDLHSSVVFSAGYNPRLYTYIEHFKDFFPHENGTLRKKIILKVSDYRSALIQGKILARKGVWVSEFRIESGLNCGGHAFATDGLLLGPILEEFKEKKPGIAAELFNICNDALQAKGLATFGNQPEMKLTVQGGIGTANEHQFLLDHYGVSSAGWGSPFLLVPEATNVDKETLQQLITAKKEDYYMSHASPLGIPFNNFRKSSSESQRKMRIEKGRPGSPCHKKFLSSDTEFTTIPICTASREYQHLKINQLKEKNLPAEIFKTEFNKITEKDCLCAGLGASALIKNGLPADRGLTAVTICPGPNLAYFSKTATLRQMVDHIYGRINILNSTRRPNMFVNELSLYVDYLKNEVQKNMRSASDKQHKYLTVFKTNLLSGVNYYKNFIPKLKHETEEYLMNLKNDLNNLESAIINLALPEMARVM